MAFDDLRSYLSALEEHGQLLRIEEQVKAEPDLAAAANATGRIGEGAPAPALWFDNIEGFTDARVALNTLGSWKNHAIAMGLPPSTGTKEQIDEFIRRWETFPVAPDNRGHYSQPVRDLPETKGWIEKLNAMLANRKEEA